MSLRKYVLTLGLVPAWGSAQAVTVAGRGPETYVLVSGLVGGVAGFHRLETRLLDRGYRVLIIDPYLLSVDSADVTFTALARRVDRVLAERGVIGAKVVAHAHGGGVMLRVAAMHPQRVAELTLLDVAAVATHQSATMSASLRFAPLVARLPGGRRFIRDKFIEGLRCSAGHQEWLDADTQRAYAEPLLDGIGRAAAMAVRLLNAREPDSIESIVARIRIPVTVLLGAAPHSTGPDPSDIVALAPLGALLRVEWLAGVGHFPHEEVPDVVMRVIAPRTVAAVRARGGAR